MRRLKVTSNSGEQAIALDLEMNQEVIFIRKDVGATVEDFIKDLAVGTVLEATAISSPTERVHNARYRRMCKTAKIKHDPPPDQ